MAVKNKGALLFVTCLFYIICVINALNLPGPRVFVVTPASKPLQIDEGRSAPFYYHNWMRRMDTVQNVTTTTTTTPKDTHDLIFAEFESENGDNMKKSIRKLLEKERIVPTSTTPALKNNVNENNVKDWTPVHSDENTHEDNTNDMSSYVSMYNNLYSSAPSPVYLPSTTVSTPAPIPSSTRAIPTTTTTSTSKVPDEMDVKNIWYIIDDEKYNQYSGKWDEQDINANNQNGENLTADSNGVNNVNDMDDDNFALPGFNINSDNGGENESRAIRTEPNIRFPYVNLKTYQMKKPITTMAYNKKGNNMFTNLDNFHDVKHPVRGEAQDVVPNNQPIDRYNSAQPYFPPNQKNSKQSSKPSGQVKTVASLVPPPPPPIKSSADYLPPPVTYDSFPPYPPALSGPALPPPPPSMKPAPPIYQPPADDSSDLDSPPEDSNDSNPPPGYQYTPPPMQFSPTLPPPPANKPFTGYTYNKPDSNFDTPPADMDTQPKYNYMPPEDHGPPSFNYGHHDEHNHPPHDTPDYPELIFKPHGGSPPVDDVKGDTNDDMGMVPPPPPNTKPTLDSPPDHGFPQDFPGDFKYHDDFEDFYHDHHHHHHHTTTTTTTSTEMPRVNRYSYYYLGKKLYYIPLYFSAYFVAYVGALIIKAVLRHKIVYPNSFRPSDSSSSFFSKRSVDSNNWNFSDEKLHEVTKVVTDALYNAAEKYMNGK